MSILDSTRKLKQIFWISFAWFLIGVIDAIFLHAVSDNEYIQRVEAYQFIPVLMAYSIGYGFSGLFVGSLLVFYLKDKFRNKSFLYYLFINTTLILIIALIMNILGYLIYFTLDLDKPFFHSDIWGATFNIFTNTINLKNLVFGLLLAFGTMVAIQINDKYGPGVFFNLLIGKYHKPREEERIFMFLDMKSSTTIAEKIGHIQFHNLLRDFFSDITDSIIYNKGEIYQYVGDEVVISWQMKHGLNDINCIRCFYDMQQSITRKKDEYIRRYGLIPEFKAGIHFGKVTTGEIGVVKKDIVFSGDVLNSAARIQSKCNELGVNILISENLLEMLNLPSQKFSSYKVGEFELRGKSERMKLHTISVDE